jgi:tetratricopeptide (TPR) repeat protein
MAALSQLSMGRILEAMDTIEKAGRLAGTGKESLSFLRAIVLVDRGKYREAEDLLRAVPDERVRRYTLGILEWSRGRTKEAADHFRACPEFYPAEYHLACATASEGKPALERLRSAVSRARAAGEWDRSKAPESARMKSDSLMRMLPFFVLGPELLRTDPPLQPLRANPETGRELRELQGP